MLRKRSWSLMLALAAGFAATGQPSRAQSDSNDLYQAVIHREFGTAVAEMTAIETQVLAAAAAGQPALEAKLIAVLEAPDATAPGRQFACQMLRVVGSSMCVPAVAKLLADEKLSHVARAVLLGMPDRKIDETLRTALETAQGNVRIGLINTLGDRRDPDSVKPLAALLKGADESTAFAALNALGKIGGSKAADALDEAKSNSPASSQWAQATLHCATSLAADGDAKRSEIMLRALVEGDYPPAARAGAFHALVMAQKEQAVPLIVQTLASTNRWMKRAALSAVIEIPGHAATQAFTKQLGGLAPESKIALLGALAARRDPEGLTETVNRLATDSDPAVSEAAIRALGPIGDATSVGILAAALTDATNGRAATKSLIELRGPGIDEALLRQAGSGPTALRASLMDTMAERKQPVALPIARQALKDADADVRLAALKIVAKVGTQADMAVLCEYIRTREDSGEIERLARAISAIGLRLTNQATRCDCVLDSLAKAGAPVKVQLLPALASLGGARALEATRAALGETNEVRKAAVRSLAEWPDAGPLEDLRKVAREEPGESVKILALRGLIRMIGLSSIKPADKVQAYREAMELATRAEDKRLVLSGLASVGQAEALKLVEPSLGDEALKREALTAYERIAESIAGKEPALAKEALQKVAAAATDDGLRRKANEALQKIK